MKQPVTELDTRFSDQDAVATDWEETRRALEDAELFWISTVRADGRPHRRSFTAPSTGYAGSTETNPGTTNRIPNSSTTAVRWRSECDTRRRRDHLAINRAPAGRA